MISLSDAIISLGWTKGTSVRDGVINWHGEEGIPLHEIQVEVTRLQAEYDALEYSRLRKEEYPAIVDQLDDIFHNGLEGWKANIQAVKDKFPKQG